MTTEKQEHCKETECAFYNEGDNCYYWKHRENGKCKVTRDFLAITQPLWDTDKEND